MRLAESAVLIVCRVCSTKDCGVSAHCVSSRIKVNSYTDSVPVGLSSRLSHRYHRTLWPGKRQKQTYHLAYIHHKKPKLWLFYPYNSPEQPVNGIGHDAILQSTNCHHIALASCDFYSWQLLYCTTYIM